MRKLPWNDYVIAENAVTVLAEYVGWQDITGEPLYRPVVRGFDGRLLSEGPVCVSRDRAQAWCDEAFADALVLV